MEMTMMDRIRKLLCELSDLRGPSGYEQQVGRFMAERLEDIADVSYDNLGSAICRLQGDTNRPRLMLAAHTDEVGFMVKTITKEGFLTFAQLGGWWDQILLGQQMVVLGRRGEVPGVIAARPPHLLEEEERKKVVPRRKMFLDIGAADKEDVTDGFGVRPGDPIVPVTKCTPIAGGKRVMGKAFDDRVGVAIVMEVLRELAESDHDNAVYGVGTAQEEVGLRGAQTAVQTVNPDVALILETAIAGDVPGIEEHESAAKLGGGPTIYVMEGSAIPNLALRDLAIDTCENLDIDYQVTVLERGGTDAGKIHVHAEGVPSLVLAVATRHIHSPNGIIDIEDVKQTIALTAELCRRLDAETLRSLLPA